MIAITWDTRISSLPISLPQETHSVDTEYVVEHGVRLNDYELEWNVKEDE